MMIGLSLLVVQFCEWLFNCFFYLFTMFELHVIVLFPKRSLCDLLALATLSTTKGDVSCRLTLSQSSWPRSSYGNFTESCLSCVTESKNASITDLCFTILGRANLIFFTGVLLFWTLHCGFYFTALSLRTWLWSFSRSTFLFSCWSWGKMFWDI